MIQLPWPADREIWSDIEGFPGYQISALGNCRSRYCRGHYPFNLTEAFRSIEGYLDNRGYRRFSMIAQDGVRRSKPAHRLLAIAFWGSAPSDLHEARHVDGSRTKNDVNNIAWGTHGENMRDMVQHGRSTAGEKSASAKLTEADVRRMFEMKARGVGSNAIARAVGVDSATASRILTGKSWKHMTEQLCA